ncbi:tripartite tricarboxylate transporter TctB family protein [Arthrobacter sp. E918]|uniref:Tripartite tricarboxylate transporter TctB family protein n=1 Tax=Arthrobacter mobilis TaxID=2724944 RepID=A0A7X6HED3_9MICC|nr:tripartite tricarboxylate transporter TctB family protein [Arthrobacter mobilis]
MAKVRRSVLAGQAVLTAVGAYVLAESAGLGLWNDLGPGPGFFPCILGAALVLLSAAWFFQERAGVQAAPAAEASDRSQVRAVVLSLLVLAAALPFIGFQTGVFLFLMYHLRLRARTSWIKSLVIALCGSVGVYYLFTLGLNVSLPEAGLVPLSLIGL